MKQVIIDRGIYRLGRNDIGREPHWESTEEGTSIVIGHEGEDFSISDKNDIAFVLTEVSKRLGLNFTVKVVNDDFGTNEEFYKCSRCNEVFDNQEVPNEGERQFCYNCGAILDWSNFIEEE